MGWKGRPQWRRSDAGWVAFAIITVATWSSKLIAGQEQFDAVTIRLSGSSNSFEGRVELYTGGVWGTICSDNWNIEEAQVACSQLGFEGAQLAVDAKIWPSTSHPGPVYLSGLHCHGTETNIAQCARDAWLDDRCSGHHGDAGVICLSQDTPASISTPMSTTIGVIISCLVAITCVSILIQYLHHRQKAAHTPQNNTVLSTDSETPIDSPYYPSRANSALFIVNGIPIDPNLPPRDLEPPAYNSSVWQPPKVPQEPPPSYEATVAQYPDAPTNGVSSPAPPEYSSASQPNAIINTRQQTESHHHQYRDPVELPGYTSTNTPPSSPLPPVD